MVRPLLKISSLALYFVFTSGQAQDDLYPRVGFNVGNYNLEVYGNSDTANEAVVGPKVGLLKLLDTGFIDVSAETYPISTENGFEGDRSELAIAYGRPLYKTLYLIIGYQYAMLGDGWFDSDFGETYGPFAGISINNLRMGEDSDNVFSLSAAAQYQSADIQGFEDTELSANIRAGYRQAGSPYSYSLKFQTFGSERHAEWITMLGVNYNLGAF